MITHPQIDVAMQTPTLERVTTDPVMFSLPTALSPLSSMEFDGFFPVKLSKNGSLENSKTGNMRAHLPVRDSFQVVSEVMSSLESEEDAEDVTNLVPGPCDVSDSSCQSSTNEPEDIPIPGLTRMSTVPYGAVIHPVALENQCSDARFIDAVIGAPSDPHEVAPEPVKQGVTTPIFLRPAPLSRSDTDETMSPPPQPSQLRTWMSWHKLELGLGDSASAIPIGSAESTEHTNPKPALQRLVPMDMNEEAMDLAISPNENEEGASTETQIKSNLSAPRQTHWKKRHLNQNHSAVTFKKMVKVNTAGEAELRPVAGPSDTKELVSTQAGRVKRRQQQQVRSKQSRDKKTWSLRSREVVAPKTTQQKPTKLQRSIVSIKTPTGKLHREQLGPARFFFEDKLSWTPWQPFILPSGLNKSWVSSTLGHSGFVNPNLFCTPSLHAASIGRPTMYELSVQIPKSPKRLVMLSKVTNSSELKVSLEQFLLRGQDRLLAQVEDVIQSGCKIYVRRAILKQKIVLLAGLSKVQISSAQQLRTVSRQMYDYAWHSKTKRDVIHRGYALSRSIL